MVLKYPNIEGAQIPPDEPVFVIRAQDALALEMVLAYVAMYCSKYIEKVDAKVIDELGRHYDVILDWQAANPEKVKMADRL